MRIKSFIYAASCVSAALIILCGCGNNNSNVPGTQNENNKNPETPASQSVSISEISAPQEMASGTASEITVSSSKTAHTEISEESMSVIPMETADGGGTSESISAESISAESITSEAFIPENDAGTETEPDDTAAVDSTSETDVTFPSDSMDNTNIIVSTAETLIGINFAEGGTSPETGFDNSGFIYYVLRQNGYINCPRKTAEQSVMGVNIPAEELRPGDLVFFSNEGNEKADFGGIYTGGGQMIYCPMPGQAVKYVDITSDYWTSSFYCAVSLN